MTVVLLTGAGRVRAEEVGEGGSWFDPTEHLGPRGWRYLTPATRYVLAAAGLAMKDAGFDPAALPDNQVGVAIGTNFAAAPVVGRFDDVVAEETAAGISPAEAPAFSVNIPASQISMRHALRAFRTSAAASWNTVARGNRSWKRSICPPGTCTAA